MTFSSISDLLAVNWNDGMVVQSRHLAHSDHRVARHFAVLARCAVDQPGLLPSSPVGPGPLVDCLPTGQDGRGSFVPVRMAGGFTAIAPSGSLVLWEPSGDADPRSRPHDRVEVPDGLQNAAELLVCARTVETPLEPLCEGPRRNGIDLVLPEIELYFTTRDRYEQSLASSTPAGVAVAAIRVAGATARVDPNYVPPVTRLTVVSSFDDRVLSRVSAEFSRLLLAVDEVIGRVRDGYVTSGGVIDGGLMSRRDDYGDLRGILYLLQGRVDRLGSLSPLVLLSEVMQPIATWWTRNQERHFPGLQNGDGSNADADPAALAASRAAILLGIDSAALCTGTDILLEASSGLLSGIADALGRSG